MFGLSKAEKRFAEKEAEKIQANDLLGHNHKRLSDGTYQKRVGSDIRIVYEKTEDSKIRIIDIFKKPNHVSHK